MDILRVLQRAIHDFSHDNCPRIAAAMAYYAVFSLAPMVLLAASIGQYVNTTGKVRERIESELVTVTGTKTAGQIDEMLSIAAERRRRGMVASIFGTALMLVGATGLFYQLQSAMNDVWDVAPDPQQGGIEKFFVKRLLSLAMLLFLALLVAASMVASALLQLFRDKVEGWLPEGITTLFVTLTDYVVSFALVTCLFAVMFKLLPDARIKWSDVWLGSVVTAVLFLAGKFGLAVYFSNRESFDVYGAAGSLVVALVGIYYQGLIFLFGAEFTQAWAEIRGGGIVAAEGAMRLRRRRSTDHGVNTNR